jgi:hypothetical protein
MSIKVCKGMAAEPGSSILASILQFIVISKSVVRSDTPLLSTSNKTQLSMGSVDLAGVPLDSFCSVFKSSSEDVDIRIQWSIQYYYKIKKLCCESAFNFTK